MTYFLVVLILYAIYVIDFLLFIMLNVSYLKIIFVWMLELWPTIGLIRQLYGSLRDVVVPEMHMEYTTRRVLIMDWVEVIGIPSLWKIHLCIQCKEQHPLDNWPYSSLYCGFAKSLFEILCFSQLKWEVRNFVKRFFGYAELGQSAVQLLCFTYMLLYVCL